MTILLEGIGTIYKIYAEYVSKHTTTTKKCRKIKKTNLKV